MIKAAMVGLGRWGQTVLGSIQGKSDRLRIVHGVTKEPELARELAAKHGFRLSTDLKDAIADPEVQAILLATPHSLHVEQVRMVAAAGKPVWCEKPLALTRAEAERAIGAVRAAGVPLGRRGYLAALRPAPLNDAVTSVIDGSYNGKIDGAGPRP